ncbi:hypothetical protein TNCV_2924721 [Trichonephila clavipes]|nr:hypothetical protein TNCV_2924721 [Trichonephila clavipes]
MICVLSTFGTKDSALHSRRIGVHPGLPLSSSQGKKEFPFISLGYLSMLRGKQRASFYQVSEFVRGRIVAYRDYRLSFREIGQSVGRNQATPQIKLSVDGGGKGLKNLHSGVNLGLGVKLYENKKKNISLDLLLNFAQKLSHIDGQLIRSKPVFSLGGTFRWGRK